MNRQKARRSCCLTLAAGLLTFSFAHIVSVSLPNYAIVGIHTPRCAGISSWCRAGVAKAGPRKELSLKRTALSASRREVLGSTAAALAGPDGFVLKSEEQQNVDLFQRNSQGVVYIANEALKLEQMGDQVQLGLMPKATGTGWVYDMEGHIVTNYHVIKEASALRIRFVSGNEIDATIIGADPGSDIAVLQVKVPPKRAAKILKPLTRGCSGTVKVGQEVFAIGNPFGLDQTLTKGIISGIGRTLGSVADGRPLQGMIQTDAAINPGNSGGPLLNTDGNVIGMNTEIYSPVGASVGVGFAIPSDTISARVQSILKYGYVKRPSLGLLLGQDGVAKQISGQDGGIVAGLQRGGAAGKAGVQATDIIIQIDDKRVKGINDVYAALDAHEPGETVTVDILRPEGEAAEDLRFKKISFSIMLQLPSLPQGMNLRQ